MIVALDSGATFLGVGAFLAGIGSLLSGMAAFHLAQKTRRNEGTMPDAIAQIAKAITASLIACLSAIGTALSDGQITGQEGITAAIALLVGLGAVWAVPNRPPNAPDPPTKQPITGEFVLRRQPPTPPDPSL